MGNDSIYMKLRLIYAANKGSKKKEKEKRNPIYQLSLYMDLGKRGRSLHLHMHPLTVRACTHTKQQRRLLTNPDSLIFLVCQPETNHLILLMCYSTITLLRNPSDHKASAEIVSGAVAKGYRNTAAK